MSKTLLYLAILAILGFGVWFFLFSDKSGTIFRSSDAAFTIHDTGAIGKIFLSANGSDQSITVERKGEDWIVNNTYPVLKSTLRSLFNTIYNQQAIHPAPDENREGIIRNIAGAGIKVEVYDREGNKMRSFFVGGETHRFSGTAMLMEGSERPYIVQIPGFEGYLTTRYTTSLGFWRDRIVFDLQPEQITQVSVQYAQEPLNSFVLTQQNGKLAVKLDPSLNMNQPLNDTRARSYLKFFSKIYCEGYLANVPELDSIIRGMPQKAVIDLQGVGGYHKTANIIYYPKDERSKDYGEVATNFDEQFNSDRYFAVINGGKDTVSVPIPFFEKIFRRGYEFFMADAPRSTEIPTAPGLPNGIGVQPK
jgi:hypothetical protein